MLLLFMKLTDGLEAVMVSRVPCQYRRASLCFRNPKSRVAREEEAPKAMATVAIGANLGNPLVTVRQAIDQLGNIVRTRLCASSDMYRSAPVGPPGQPDYVNAAAVLLTSLAPVDLLDALQSLEGEFGRDRSGERWGARALDLDIVTYQDREIDEERLTVPHPEAYHRCFVLVPLAQIAPDTLIPGHGRVAELVDDCDTGAVQKIEPARA